MDNPIRSEAATFRLFVFILLAALPIILIGAIFGPTAGAITLLVEIGLALGVAIALYRARRAAHDASDSGSNPQ